MFEDIKKNKIKSGFIVSGFILIVTLVIYYIAMAFDFDGPVAIFIALLFSVITSFASYYNSDKVILSVTKARPATEEEDTKIVHILDALMLSAGLSHRPRLYVVDDAQPNAFATGRNPEHSIICVTTGLLDKLDYYELEGVIAHEMGHIKNYDILLTSIVTVMVGFLVMISDLFSRSLFWRNSNNKDDDNNGNAILMIIGLILLIISPILGEIMKLALSRRREYLADATAAEITRNPQGLISALRKLDNDTNELKTANKATANLFIVTPFRNKNGTIKKASLFDTHPSIDERIKALENIQ